MKVKCDKCSGHGFVEVELPKLSLSGLLVPFMTNNMIGFKIKDGAELEPLKPLNYPDVKANAEAFGDVAEKLHNKE